MIIGRVSEQKQLRRLLQSREAEFLAVYGRRRIGKTYLIQQYFSKANCLFLHVTGIKNGSLRDQIAHVTEEISRTFFDGLPLQPPSSWQDLFTLLNNAIESVSTKQKVVLFFDEFPWMVTRRGGLLSAIDHSWNRYLSINPRVRLIICGSSASWILKNIINNTGGLYNRVTARLNLEPFNLHETKAFLASRKIRLTEKQVTDLYMVTGGVPHYLKQIPLGKSVTQIIDTLCFQKDGVLFGEFDQLFASLFDDTADYVTLVKAIAKHRSGITQADLIRETKLPAGGRTVKRLSDLEACGFIQSDVPKGNRRKGKFYKLIDEYTLFYLQWILPLKSSLQKRGNRSYFAAQKNTNRLHAWAGYAFEAICFKHLPQVELALDLDKLAPLASSFRHQPTKQHPDISGTQIDLLFERSDDAVTLCEIKYTDKPFALDKKTVMALHQKQAVYETVTGTSRQVFTALISASGVKKSKYIDFLDGGVVTLSDLFKS